MANDLASEFRTAAKDLAVRYYGFMRANESDDWNGLAVWGQLLLEAQERIGIEILRPNLLQARIETGKRRLAEAEQVAA